MPLSIEKLAKSIESALVFMTINYQFIDIIHRFLHFRKVFSIKNYQKILKFSLISGSFHDVC